jgi:hypothetical protein
LGKATDEFVKNFRLIGYVRVQNRDDMFITDQNSSIEGFANKEGLDLVQIEHEASNGNQIMRVGLWKVLRLMTCTSCPPKTMPMADQYDYWFREATRPCTCKCPNPASGILVDNITVLCTTPAQGAKFALDMCAARKHLFVAEGQRCMSCCNPQAVKLVMKQMSEP